MLTQKTDVLVEESQLSDEEFLIYQALQRQSSLKVQDVIAILDKKNVFPVIQKLMNRNLLVLQEEISETYKPKLIRYIRLHADYESDESLNQLLNTLKGPKQTEIILQYFQCKSIDKSPIAVKKLIEAARSTSAVVKALVDKNIFEEYYLQHDRVSFSGKLKQETLRLSEAQQRAFESVQTS